MTESCLFLACLFLIIIDRFFIFFVYCERPSQQHLKSKRTYLGPTQCCAALKLPELGATQASSSFLEVHVPISNSAGGLEHTCADAKLKC